MGWAHLVNQSAWQKFGLTTPWWQFLISEVISLNLDYINITFGRKHINHPSTQHQYYLGYYFWELSVFHRHIICLWVIISDERTNNFQFSSAAFFILPCKLSTKLKYKFRNTSPKTIKTGIKEKKKKKTKTHFSRVGQTR